MPLRLCLLALLLSLTPLAQAATLLTGRIVAVSDGDTLTLLRDSDRRQYRIRLQGIDAPERRQAFGNRARQTLAALAHRQAAVAHCETRDDYGRWLCTVSVGQRDLGLQMIERGMAWHYRHYARQQTAELRTAYAQAEADARAARRGLWQDARPVAPWTWRRLQAQNRN